MKPTRKLLAALLAILFAFSLCACGGDSDTGVKTDNDVVSSDTQESSETESSDEEETAAFEVKVVDDMGNPVEGVMLQICKESCIPAKTDANGIATFNIEITDGYKLSVMTCPTGYEYTGEAEVYLEDGATEYTLELSEAK